MTQFLEEEKLSEGKIKKNGLSSAALKFTPGTTGLLMVVDINQEKCIQYFQIASTPETGANTLRKYQFLKRVNGKMLRTYSIL